MLNKKFSVVILDGILALSLGGPLVLGQPVNASVRHQQMRTGDRTQTPSDQLSSNTIRRAQNELKARGYDVGQADGILGPKTREALRKFQQDQGLTASGRLTRETANRLGIATVASNTGNSDTPAEYFEEAGEALVENYGEAGKTVGRGTEKAIDNAKEGEVTEAGKSFGSGVGGFGNKIGKGTYHAVKSFFLGVKDVFDGAD